MNEHQLGRFALEDDLAGPNDAYLPVLVVGVEIVVEPDVGDLEIGEPLGELLP